MEYKQGWQGGEVVKVGRFFPSSKRCHVCGTVNPDLALAERRWQCGGCGASHNRDENAAKNIEVEGLALRAGGGYVGTLSSPVELAATTVAQRCGSKLRAVKQERTDAHF